MKSRARSVIALAVLLSAGVAGKASAQCTNTPLPAAGIGPVNPANGYPRYYVDASGLDVMDRKLLRCVLDKFAGGPVGIDNLSAAIGEERDTIEDVLEPFLIQQGFLQRTNRGRIATALSYRHFGLAPPGAVGELFSSE